MMDLEKKYDEHELRIRKLEESNIKMEMQLQEISKGQLELKNLMYENQREQTKLLDNVTTNIVGTLTATVNSNNTNNNTNTVKFWVVIGAMVALASTIIVTIYK